MRNSKNYVNILIGLLIILLVGCSNKPKIAPKASLTVYITNTGECYHLKSCRCLKYSCYPVTLEEASEQLRPCSICDAPIYIKPKAKLAPLTTFDEGLVTEYTIFPEHVSKYLVKPETMETVTTDDVKILIMLDSIGAFKQHYVEKIVSVDYAEEPKISSLHGGVYVIMSRSFSNTCATTYCKTKNGGYIKDALTEISLVIDNSVTVPYMYFRYDLPHILSLLQDSTYENPCISEKALLRLASIRYLVVNKKQYNKIIDFTGIPEN